jgi:hypothetical protein
MAATDSTPASNGSSEHDRPIELLAPNRSTTGSPSSTNCAAPSAAVGTTRPTYGRHEPNDLRPNDWQALLPDYVPAARDALDEVFSVLSGIKGDRNDRMLEAAVARRCVARIEAWVVTDLESDINFRMPDDDSTS